MTSNRQTISNYKADVLKHPLKESEIHQLTSDALISAVFLMKGNPTLFLSLIDEVLPVKETLDKLAENALLDEHELTFLSHSLQLIAKLDDDNRYKLVLNHAVYASLVRYVASLIETTTITSMILNLMLGSSSPASICFDFLKILVIDRAQTNLQHLIRKNDNIDLRSLVIALLEAPIALLNPYEMYETAKNVVSNTYEFIQTNCSFFYRKVIDTTPVEYKLPTDLRP